MPNLNTISSDITSLRKRTLKDVRNLLQMYSTFERELGTRFRREVAQNKGSLDELEDFRSLHVMVKRNRLSVQSALNILSRMRDIMGYNIEEEIDKELKEILSD